MAPIAQIELLCTDKLLCTYIWSTLIVRSEHDHGWSNLKALVRLIAIGVAVCALVQPGLAGAVTIGHPLPVNESEIYNITCSGVADSTTTSSSITVAGSGSNYGYVAPFTGVISTYRVQLAKIYDCSPSAADPNNPKNTEVDSVDSAYLRIFRHVSDGTFTLVSEHGPFTVNAHTFAEFTGLSIQIQEGDFVSFGGRESSLTPQSLIYDSDSTDETYVNNLSGVPPIGVEIDFNKLMLPGISVSINVDLDLPNEPTPVDQPTLTPSPAPSLSLSTPSFSTTKRVKLKSSTLFRRYLRTGFKGTFSGYGKIEAYLLRVKYFNIQSKKSGKTTTVRKKRCYKVHRRRSLSCSTLTTNGVTKDGSGAFNIKPLGSSDRAKTIRNGLNSGRRIPAGKYDLTIKAYPSSGGSAQTFTYRFNVTM